MRLLIISNMAHYLQDGQLVGWGPTVQEIDALATLFDEVVHIGCLHSGPPPPSSLPYQARNVRFVGVPPAGGSGLAAKMGILRRAPQYMRTMLRELSHADVVHVRCPANISMMAIVLLSLVHRPKYRWVKYAGNWKPEGKEPWSYTFQRWWLNRGLHEGVVTVNGKWPDQPDHVYSFYNPCLTREELEMGRKMADEKRLEPPYELLFVGRVEEAKGVGRALNVAKMLKKEGIDFRLHIVGGGPELPSFKALAREYGLDGDVKFYGWLPKPKLSDFYSRAHFMVFPSSSSEGWPKVLSEAMAYGVVPVAGAVSSIPQILATKGAGFSVSPTDVHGFLKVLLRCIRSKEEWYKAKEFGVSNAGLFTYDYYLEKVKEMFREAGGIF